MNAHEHLGRLTKVAAMLETLDRLTEPPTSAEIAAWPGHVWEMLAAASDVNPPSPVTIELTIARVREREGRRSAPPLRIVRAG